MKGTMVATWNMAYQGVKEAMEMLCESERPDIHQAILHAIKNVEDNPEFVSVGYGGLPNYDGEVELDAAFMDGNTLGFGGVIEVKNVKNPIEIAYHLSKYKRNCLLAGAGAVRYAERNGFSFGNMLTERSNQRYLEEKQKAMDPELLKAYEGHDTVCVIGKLGEVMACGVSTSGLYFKHPGRVGDSPVIGSGFYADVEIGSAAATGVGEDIMKGCLSFSIVERMKGGMDVQTACETALTDHISRLKRGGYEPGSMSVIAMDKENSVGAATSQAVFPFVVGGPDGECTVYAALCEEGKVRIIKTDDEWQKEYKGD